MTKQEHAEEQIVNSVIARMKASGLTVFVRGCYEGVACSITQGDADLAESVGATPLIALTLALADLACLA